MMQKVHFRLTSAAQKRCSLSSPQNRGERFFRVVGGGWGGGGRPYTGFFFTMTALKIRNTYLNDDRYSSIGFRMGLILLSKTKIVY